MRQLSMWCCLPPFFPCPALQSQTNPWTFCLSYWELYGYFYKLRKAGGASSNSSSSHKIGAAATE
jgi:hypothetical protein